MGPFRLFEYFLAVGCGLFTVGLCLFLLFLLFATVAAWAKRPSESADPAPQLSNPYSAENVVRS